MLRLHGVICPIITPFAKDGSLEEDALKTHVEFLIDNGVHGIFPLGTAGEFALLSARERRRVVEVTAEATQGRVPVLAGVSDPGSGNAAEYARAAEKAGADAVVATPPYYYAVDARGVQAHFETIADAVEIPLILYNIPSWTHVSIPADVVLKLAENNYVVAMKHTTNDLA
ncbi:MAG: dihydrodipicolinate synthase family protein, partial [Candidatus Bathyarchaeia archaeon]